MSRTGKKIEVILRCPCASLRSARLKVLANVKYFFQLGPSEICAIRPLEGEFPHDLLYGENFLHKIDDELYFIKSCANALPESFLNELEESNPERFLEKTITSVWMASGQRIPIDNCHLLKLRTIKSWSRKIHVRPLICTIALDESHSETSEFFPTPSWRTLVVNDGFGYWDHENFDARKVCL